MENENPNQGGAHTQEQVSDMPASETVKESVTLKLSQITFPATNGIDES